MKKRGLSAVVTTLIIILLTIVAIGIVWVVVKNILDKGSDEITLTGLTLDLEIVRAVVDGDTLEVTVKRNPGEGNLVGINFVFSDGENSAVARRDTTLAQLGMQTFTFTLSQLPIGDLTSISIAAIFETSSGKETFGDVIDTSTYGSSELGSGGGSDAPGDDCVELCVPEQTCLTEGFDCGSFEDDCGDLQDCGGECDGTDVCTNNFCIPDDCVPLAPLDACTNAGYECGNLSNEETCGNPVNCSTVNGGTCAQQHPIGNWKCEANMCIEILAINLGLIEATYPPGTGLYFDSDTLTKEDNLYYGYFAGFPSVDQVKCYTIVEYSYDGAVYGNAIVGLALQGQALLISVTDPYEIWPGDAQGNINCITSISS